MSGRIIVFLILTLIPFNDVAAQNKRRKPRHEIAAQSSSNNHWYILNSPDKDFIIEFPTKPEHIADNEAPSGTSRNYILNQNSTLYQLSYVDTGFRPTDYDANQFPPKFGQGLIDDIKSKGATLIRSQLLRINVFEYEILFPRKGDRDYMLHSIDRHVIRYGRQYTLSCSSTIPNQKVNAEICRSFFGSFRILRAPQPH